MSYGEILIEQLRISQVTLSDIAINNLFVHIAIAYKRIEEGHHIELIEQDIVTIREKREYQVAFELVREIEQALGVSFPETEVSYIAIHLMGTKLVNEDRSANQEIETVMDESIHSLTQKMLDAVDNKFSLNIKDDKELIIGLGLHLKPAINRYTFGMTIRNPMLEDIKNNYPLAFEAVILAALVLDKELNVSIDENEVAYLALHIGAAIERKKAGSGPKRCYIVCASGVGSAQLIKYKIESEFYSLNKTFWVRQSITKSETSRLTRRISSSALCRSKRICLSLCSK
ncbi:MAG: PRD domain-containing protein [Alkalibacterium sp.]|nr:PRD domain-containing protein [Alkalibacterium sp.]